MNAITTAPRRVLMLAAADESHSSFLELLPPGTLDVCKVHDLAEAAAALREGRFDFVISSIGDFAALERAASAQQSVAVMERLGQGVCMIDLAGRVVWSNAKMRTFPSELVEKISEHCRKALSGSAELLAAKPSRHFPIPTTGDQHFEVEATALIEPGGRATQMLAVAWDVSNARRLQRKIDAIDLAGRELVSLELETIAQLDVQGRLELLEDKIYKCMKELLNFDNFAVMLLNQQDKKLSLLLQHGMQESVAHLDIHAATEGNGICGYVAATGRSYNCHDTSKDGRYIQGLANAKSSLSVPLRQHNKIVGVFNIESHRLGAFNEDDRQFAEILARYISLSIQVMELLAVERHAVSESLAEDVTAEISCPLNEILTTTSALMEDCIGHEQMHRKLGLICDNVAKIRKIIRDVTHPTCGLLSHTRDESPHDPLLNGKRALVADDEDLIRETVSGILTKQGCAVDTASNGVEAIRLIQSQPYDLVISDIRMPDKDGYEVFAAARAARTGIPVILITGFGYDPRHQIVRANSEGLAAVLFKPFGIEDLMVAVRKALTVSACGGGQLTAP